MVIIEGDMLDPRVFAAIQETRDNMAEPSPNDPGKYTKTPLGTPELHAVDELVWAAKASMFANFTPFIEVGWESDTLECDTLFTGLPDDNDRDCLRFIRIRVCLWSSRRWLYSTYSSVIDGAKYRS